MGHAYVFVYLGQEAVNNVNRWFWWTESEQQLAEIYYFYIIDNLW